ncbi:hypothetical protein E4U43_001926 [Claviceps pusilla]|uniref:Uncharacterized protein n=1 Tax=Claviceps pusilla TaxID=123648 RepID=A0A9P7NGX6_9HYPO|nr:hypothetical protein E4U43_001926 [Claviceps pusilla]
MQIPILVMLEICIQDFLPADGALGPGSNSLVAHSQADHGGNLIELQKRRFLSGIFLQDELMDVVCDVVPRVHGEATALDARPFCEVTRAKVVFCVGGSGGEHDTVGERVEHTDELVVI